MKRQEVLRKMKLKKLPSKVDIAPKGVKCIAKVAREWGEPDFAFFKDGRCVEDKGFVYRIKEVLQYYYDAPVNAESKLEEVQRLAAEAQRQKDIEAIWDEAHEENKKRSLERPAEYKAMLDFIKEHKLAEKTFGMSADDANKLLDSFFA